LTGSPRPDQASAAPGARRRRARAPAFLALAAARGASGLARAPGLWTSG